MRFCRSEPISLIIEDGEDLEFTFLMRKGLLSNRCLLDCTNKEGVTQSGLSDNTGGVAKGILGIVGGLMMILIYFAIISNPGQRSTILLPGAGAGAIAWGIRKIVEGR